MTKFNAFSRFIRSRAKHLIKGHTASSTQLLRCYTPALKKISKYNHPPLMGGGLTGHSETLSRCLDPEDTITGEIYRDLEWSPRDASQFISLKNILKITWGAKL